MWEISQEIEKNYMKAVEESVVNNESFDSFKSNRSITEIYEHVSVEHQAIYLKLASEKFSGFSEFVAKNQCDPISLVHFNDVVGDATIVDYKDVYGFCVSPSTSRYLYVTCDMISKKLPINNVVEIGCGYGGQCFVTSLFNPNVRYTLIDQYWPARLQKRYLSSISNQSNLQFLTDDSYPIGRYKPGSTLVSNFALSELDGDTKRQYLDFFLAICSHGYITSNWNTSLITDYLSEKNVKFQTENEPEGIGNSKVIWW